MKQVKRLIAPTRPHWVGDGFQVYPIFNNLAFTNELSPFLMLDYGAPKYFKPTSRKLGVGQHPHRGFETVTIAFQGEVEHGDSAGHRDTIGPGDVQWMTAASGIIHEEFHSSKFAKEGGTFEMIQLWVNLPAKYKMTTPRYQPILKDEIPVMPLPGGVGEVRVIAGECGGVIGKASTFSPVNLWDVHLAATRGSAASLLIPEGHKCIVFVRSGTLNVGGGGQPGDAQSSPQRIEMAQAAVLTDDGTTLHLENVGSEPCKFMILSGEPLNEPIANRGPFVMNTESELNQAMMDYQSGRMGKHFN